MHISSYLINSILVAGGIIHGAAARPGSDFRQKSTQIAHDRHVDNVEAGSQVVGTIAARQGRNQRQGQRNGQRQGNRQRPRPGQQRPGQPGQGQGAGQGQNPGQEQIILSPELLQPGSSKTGQEPGTEGIKEGQAPSATDSSNFINFCKGSTLTNGMQITDGSCNGIPMGRIPAVSNMISAMILSPKHGEVLQPNQGFAVTVQTRGLNAGNFVNPTTNYYTAPQDLDENGNIIGHCHVTVQAIGSFDSQTPPDPSVFAYFKGIDDAGNGQGLLTANFPEGLTPGFYRVCTMIAAQNHQPVSMPVAQRGAQDDCTKFEVRGDGNNDPSGNAQNDKNAADNQEEMGFIVNDGEAQQKTDKQQQETGGQPQGIDEEQQQQQQ